MKSFGISVPGKVILFGEHSVVYHKTAIAASLNQRTSLYFDELPPTESSIQLEMPKIGLSIRIPVNQAVSHVRAFVDTLSSESAQHKASLECFLYAMLQIRQHEDFELVAFRLKLDTELSVGAGQGSSASFSVSLVACFLRLARLQKDPRAPPNWSQQDRDQISSFAFNCEKIMHGAPSGIDNTICTFGSLVEFRKGSSPAFIPLVESRKIKILLVDTKVARSTKVLVDRLAGLRSNYPQIFDPVLEAMDGVAKRVVQLLKDMQTLPIDDVYRELSVLIDLNQGLLATCQVSHASLDTICMSAKKHGFSAKLTGAGGGGFAFVLVPPDAPQSKVCELTSELTAHGFSVSETNLGGSGVEIFET